MAITPDRRTGLPRPAQSGYRTETGGVGAASAGTASGQGLHGRQTLPDQQAGLPRPAQPGCRSGTSGAGTASRPGSHGRQTLPNQQAGHPRPERPVIGQKQAAWEPPALGRQAGRASTDGRLSPTSRPGSHARKGRLSDRNRRRGSRLRWDYGCAPLSRPGSHARKGRLSDRDRRRGSRLRWITASSSLSYVRSSRSFCAIRTSASATRPPMTTTSR